MLNHFGATPAETLEDCHYYNLLNTNQLLTRMNMARPRILLKHNEKKTEEDLFSRVSHILILSNSHSLESQQQVRKCSAF